RRAVDQVVARILLGGAAREAKVQLNEKAVEAAIEEQRRIAGGAEKLTESIKQVGLTEAELRRITSETVLVRQFIEEVMAPSVKVTDEEVKSEFEAHPEWAKHDEQIKLRMILVEPVTKPGAKPAGTTSPHSPEATAAALARAEALLARLKAGSDFAEVAKEASDDPTKSLGGEVGWVGRGQLLPELEKPAFELQAGQISAVIQSSRGFHIFKVDERRPAGLYSLDEVREPVRHGLRNRRIAEALRAKVDNLKSTAKIVYLDPAVEAAVLGRPAPAAAGGAAAPAPKAAPATRPAAPPAPTGAPK
ncbi:MAG: peptidylprolyl isomerase, partial [Thermoanaerobaculaceae bacterium]|nr:peptidylprolyl isomerase [Thermoanaerobaculaceae bacterium]